MIKHARHVPDTSMLPQEQAAACLPVTAWDKMVDTACHITDQYRLWSNFYLAVCHTNTRVCSVGDVDS